MTDEQVTKSKIAQSITHKQSQTLVNELVSISLNCITYLRNVFGDENYIDRKFISNERLDIKGNFVKTKHLVAGISREADMFMSWIECGVNSALALQYLLVLQFTIYLDEDHPERLCESYVFQFDYKSDSMGFFVNGEEKYKMVAELNAREKVQQLIRRLIVSTQAFGPLPEQKYISVRLLFNENCPSDYQPSFFKDASDLEPSTITVDSDACKHDIGALNTGHHYASIRILSNAGVRIKNPVRIDPFDIIHIESLDANEFENRIEFPKVDDSLSLNKFLQSNRPENFESTQPVPSQQYHLSNCKVTCECNCWRSSSRIKLSVKGFAILTCHACQRKVHSCCYGLNLSASIKKSIPTFKCYTCLLETEKLEQDLVLLMRLRYLWKYMYCYDIPENFNFYYEIFNLSYETDDDVVRKMLNRLFQDKILIVLHEPVMVKGNKKASGTGTLVSSIDLLYDNKGNPIYKNKAYSIAFSPGVKTSKVICENDKQEFYLPDMHNTKSLILSILQEFKEGVKNRECDDDPIESSSLNFHQKSSPSMESVEIFGKPYNEYKTSHRAIDNLLDEDINELSFEDSLNFLSQPVSNQNSNTITSLKEMSQCIESNKRKFEENSFFGDHKLKSKKISVNEDPCF